MSKYVKYAVFVLISAMVIMSMAACGEKQKEEPAPEEETGCQVAMICESEEMSDGSFINTAWSCVQKVSGEYDLTAKSYDPKDDTKDEYMAAINTAVGDGAEFIVLPGSNFETTAYAAQSEYPDIHLLLIDGVPNDGKNSYVTAENTVSVIFAEEEAGYMAGYAAVKDGYKRLGFMGGKELPSVKRYGYGFIQGAAVAAEETKTKVEMRYKYTGSFEASDDAEKLAAGWYKDGTQVIFACGGSMGGSVMKAAETGKGKVIGVDVDQSALSETVITSAKKGIYAAVETVLKDHANGKFSGGTAFNYTAKNDGVSLEMTNARFNKFTEEDYKKLFGSLKRGKIELKKDTGVDSISELTGEWVTIKE